MQLGIVSKFTLYYYPVEGIKVLYHFLKNDLIPVFSCLNFLVIVSCYIYIYPILSNNSSRPYVFKEITFCALGFFRQVGFPIHFISVAHWFPLVLIEDITQMWQDACNIWKCYMIKCYKMLVIFTYNDRHYVILRKRHITFIPPNDMTLVKSKYN